MSILTVVLVGVMVPMLVLILLLISGIGITLFIRQRFKAKANSKAGKYNITHQNFINHFQFSREQQLKLHIQHFD